MLLFLGCLLLLACAAVQCLTTWSTRRSALLAAGAATLLHVLAATRAAIPWAGTALLAIAFWLACAAILAGHAHLAQRLEAFVALCDIDEATRCLNRRGFSRRLDAACAQAMRDGLPVALLALDLDHFKQVNDQFGHLTGDAVLGEVSAFLMKEVGEHGVVARLGGEEFAVLLPRTDAEGAGVMAERIVAAARALRLHALPASVRLTLSIGIAAERIHHAGSSDSLRARSDEALYAAKRSGRDRALLWAPGVHSHATPIRSVRGITMSMAPLGDLSSRPR